MPSPKTYPATRAAVLDCCEDGQQEEIHHRCEELFQALVHASLRTHFDRLSAEETLYLVTGDGERVQISPEMYGPLTSVARAFADRKDVCVVCQDRLMTTQEAADYLGVSRPTVVRLLERGDIPFERINTHRRVAFDDLERYRLEHEYVNRRVR